MPAAHTRLVFHHVFGDNSGLGRNIVCQELVVLLQKSDLEMGKTQSACHKQGMTPLASPYHGNHVAKE
jgi:hypothetical protein